MNQNPTWAELVAREPKLGDVLADVRAYRGHDAECFFWAPGGIADRLRALLAALDWPGGFLADTNDTPLGMLWHALPVQKGARTDTPDFGNDEDGTYDAAAHRAWNDARLMEAATALDRLARELKASGRDGDAALSDALARLAAANTDDDDAALAAALRRLNGVLARSAGAS
jgi:hypothetical protein